MELKKLKLVIIVAVSTGTQLTTCLRERDQFLLVHGSFHYNDLWKIMTLFALTAWKYWTETKNRKKEVHHSLGLTSTQFSQIKLLKFNKNYDLNDLALHVTTVPLIVNQMSCCSLKFDCKFRFFQITYVVCHQILILRKFQN